MKRKRLDRLSDLSIVVLSGLNFHAGHGREDIAAGLRADGEEIERLCAGCMAVGHRARRPGSEVPERGTDPA